MPSASTLTLVTGIAAAVMIVLVILQSIDLRKWDREDAAERARRSFAGEEQGWPIRPEGKFQLKKNLMWIFLAMFAISIFALLRGH